MDEERAANIISKAYDILDATSDIEVREPCPDHEDVLIRHQALRERSRDYEALRERSQPPPARPGREPPLTRSDLLDERQVWIDVMGKVIGEQRKRIRQQVKSIKSELEGLRCELSEARAEIKRLQSSRASKVVTWHLDEKNYRVLPFQQDGTTLPVLDLRPFFVTYNNETT